MCKVELSLYCVILGKFNTKLCKHFIKQESLNLLNLLSKLSVIYLPIHNRVKNTSTSTNNHTSMVIQTKSVFKYVLH